MIRLRAGINSIATSDHKRQNKDGVMVLGKLPVPGRPTYLEKSRARALAVGAGGHCLDIFSHLSFFFSFSLSLGDGPI